jgi:predicted nucleotidyltransferase
MMTPEDFVAKIRQREDFPLRSAILYGSAAAGDHVGKKSDFNLMIIADRLGRAELDALAKPVRAWVRAGNAAPVLFTPERLKNSADVFPIELLDMRDNRKVLFGEDLLADLVIHPENLRLELEHELKTKLLRLREEYLLSAGRARAVRALMVQSIGTCLVLIRAALRLFIADIPAKKMDALRALPAHLAFDPEVFEQIERMKEGQDQTPAAEMSALFERYLRGVESVVDAVDAHLHTLPDGAGPDRRNP